MAYESSVFGKGRRSGGTFLHGASPLAAASRSVAFLTAGEERDLVLQAQAGSEAARSRLVLSHMRLVSKIAGQFERFGLPDGDLVSEGMVGFVEALRRFDVDKGFRLSTYAGWWIKAQCQAYVIANWSLVKLGTTADQKKLFFGLRKARATLVASDPDLTPEEVDRRVSVDMGVPLAEVRSMGQRLSGDVALDAPFDHEGERGTWLDRLVDGGPSPEHLVGEHDELAKRSAALRRSLECLNPRERNVFERRRLDEDTSTLEDLARVYGVTRERIRQIEVRAMEKVRAAFARIAADGGLGAVTSVA